MLFRKTNCMRALHACGSDGRAACCFTDGDHAYPQSQIPAMRENVRRWHDGGEMIHDKRMVEGSLPMKPSLRTQTKMRNVALSGLLAAVCAIPFTAVAGSEHEQGPLVIRDQGNFYVGGHLVDTPYNDTCQTAAGCAGIAPFEGGTDQVDQAYVDYQFPQDKSFKYPIVFTHGGGHHGGYFESTPDRREGWRTHFVKAGFDSYVLDDVNRGRSGYDIRHIVAVAWGVEPPSAIERVNKYSLQRAWTGFRIGPTYPVPAADSRFPVESFVAYSGQLVPAYRLPIETDRNVHAFVSLLNQVGPAVLVTWSQSGSFGWLSALQAPAKFAAIVALEGGVPDLSTQAKIDVYKKIPILFVIGDHSASAAAQAHAAEQTLLNAGGIAKALVLPEAGITGNSHVFVVEKNNLQIADLVIDWLKKNVKGGKDK
jgi:pimeloyl-ACP methyl ester carboxylesterase